MRSVLAAAAAAAVVSFAVAAGCSAPEPQPVPVPAPETPVAPAPVLDPARVTIAKIGAESSLVPTGQTADGHWEIPPLDEPEQASWYRPGPEPGEVGRPAVILGHVNGNGRAGVFARLHELDAGDEIVVTDVAGHVRTFVVVRTEQAPKAAFLTDATLGVTTRPELRLITCGGELQQAEGRGRYADNIIVSAAERA